MKLSKREFVKLINSAFKEYFKVSHNLYTSERLVFEQSREGLISYFTNSKWANYLADKLEQELQRKKFEKEFLGKIK